jgi:deazaflavin-dependent oxidoreductase (nitroreductase family)
MKMQQILNNLANPAMKWLLRSPLHRLASGRVVLIEFVGRKSGKTYRTPVMYAATTDGIVVSTSRDYLWWRNLSGGARVRLWLRGREQKGVADVSQDAADIDRALRAIYPKASDAMRAEMTKRVLVIVSIHVEEPS